MPGKSPVAPLAARPEPQACSVAGLLVRSLRTPTTPGFAAGPSPNSPATPLGLCTGRPHPARSPHTAACPQCLSPSVRRCLPSSPLAQHPPPERVHGAPTVRRLPGSPAMSRLRPNLGCMSAGAGPAGSGCAAGAELRAGPLGSPPAFPPDPNPAPPHDQDGEGALSLWWPHGLCGHVAATGAGCGPVPQCSGARGEARSGPCELGNWASRGQTAARARSDTHTRPGVFSQVPLCGHLPFGRFTGEGGG